MKVLIIGAGLGGLSLAQALRRANIPFEIFERDKTPFDRPQGYRLHLDGDAINTVHEILPPELLTLFKETSYSTEPYTSIMDPKSLRVVKRLLTRDDLGTGMWPPTDPEATPVHANVDRAVLRRILLTGLDEYIQFGKQFERYETIGEDKVTVHFADGSSAIGSVVVGADGVNSRVRRQRAPTCTTMDAGITAIYGRLPLSALRELGPKEALEDIFLIAIDQRKLFLGLGSVIFPTLPDEAAKKLSTKNAMHAQESYAVCIVGGRHEYFPENVHSVPSAELQDVAAGLVDEWSGNAAPLLRAADPDSFFTVRMRTSVPSTLDSPTNVTLLGDSIHSMTPSLGRGANLAMRHGALLARHLKKVAAGEGSIAAELGRYEKSMTGYGFQVVREAAQMGQQRMAQNSLETRA
ncbi:FAD-dependent oxidoreductase [Neohortaea acidophila]|uniref:FAD-dependent oxidoreductase n=1 Tax=Neohortaea acidophila TaxID=245834 RepID=A0A6A6PPU1_9PEZI|nr:FAD-dependent oxidoreductase [Neohortaea acidophila]KAF2481816.1 FAD-dependent oxidoreductase [Neohortaea acidophila]